MSKGEETRKRIVAEAAGLFNRRGYEGSSMAELMEATGLEKGGIYRHFSGKEELAAEAFDYAWQAARDARWAELDEIPNSVDRLKQFVRNFVERRSPVPGGCPLLNTAVEADDGNPVLRERARKALRAWRQQLARGISEGISKREIRKSVQPEKVAALIISVLEGALMMSRLEKDPAALQTAREHLEDYLESQVRAG